MKKVSLHATLVVLIFAISMTLVFSGSALGYSKEKPMIIKCAIDNPPKDIKAGTKARKLKAFNEIRAVTGRANGRINEHTIILGVQ